MGKLDFLRSTLIFVPFKCKEEAVNKVPILARIGPNKKSDNKKQLAVNSWDTDDGPRSRHINEIVNVDSIGDAACEVAGAPLKSSKYLIKEDEGKVLFLKKLLLTRRLFQHKQNFAAAHARLLGEVREAGVDVDLREVEKRRRYWQDVHNGVKRGNQTSLYAAPLSVIFDGAPIEILKGTEFEEDGSNSELPMMLTDPRKIAKIAVQQMYVVPGLCYFQRTIFDILIC